MLSIGIIGFGKMGQTRYAAAEASGLARAQLFYDPASPPPAGRVAAPSAEALIQSPDLDAVFICTPNHQNQPLTLAALRAGKHVFCEKPPAFTAADVETVRTAERETGKRVMYGFNHRHHQSIQSMKSMIGSGRFGRLLWMRGRYGKSVDHNYFSTWRAKKELAGGGILIDQGIHMLDLFLHLGETFDEVQAMVSSLYWNLPGIEDNVFAQLRNSRTGVVASLHSTMTQWRHLFSLEVFLERGYMVLNGLKTQSGSYGDEILTIAKNRSMAPAATWEDEEKLTYHLDNSWADETTAFLRAVTDNAPIAVGNSTDAFKVMQLVDRIYAETHHQHEHLHSRLNP
jgi:1,5-anhydro-D-fructose reductase (1,5-anhydro-D-mannitol-forming)